MTIEHLLVRAGIRISQVLGELIDVISEQLAGIVGLGLFELVSQLDKGRGARTLR